MFARTLKRLRKGHGLTQQQLADKLFVDCSSVTKWETGKANPDFEKQQKLADFFNVSIDYLFGRELNFDNELSIARNRCKNLCDVFDINIPNLEKTIGTNYATFRAWIDGLSDYFNQAIPLSRVASYFNVSLDYLLGRSDVPNQQLEWEDDTLKVYSSLNPDGKSKILAYMEDLIANPKYTADSVYMSQEKAEDLPAALRVLPSFEEIYEEQENQTFSTDRLGDDMYEYHAAFGGGVWKEKKKDDNKFDKK